LSCAVAGAASLRLTENVHKVEAREPRIGRHYLPASRVLNFRVLRVTPDSRELKEGKGSDRKDGEREKGRQWHRNRGFRRFNEPGTPSRARDKNKRRK